MTDELEILQRLISCPSENPPGDEEAVAAACREILEILGGEISIHRARPSRPNIIARFHGLDDGPIVILQAHLDTKPIDHHGGREVWTSDPFTLVIRDGKAYGVGAADTKGGAAAQLAAIAHTTSRSMMRGELVWIGAADEENGALLGSGYLQRKNLLGGDVALVAEPTDCRPSLAQLGNVWLRVETRGHGGHAGTPGMGRDAVDAMLRCLQAMRDLIDRRLPDPRFPGHPRLNVGRIEGGAHCGTIASYCSADIDVRLRPGESRSQTTTELTKVAKGAAGGLGVEVSIAPYAQGGCRPHEVDPKHPLIGAFLEAASLDGVPSNPLPFSGGTDAYFFGDQGVPTVVFGPGSLQQAHAPDEYVEIAQLRRATQVYKHFLAKLLGS